MQSTLFEEMRNDHKRMTRRSWLLIILALTLLIMPMLGCAQFMSYPPKDTPPMWEMHAIIPIATTPTSSTLNLGIGNRNMFGENAGTIAFHTHYNVKTGDIDTSGSVIGVNSKGALEHLTTVGGAVAGAALGSSMGPAGTIVGGGLGGVAGNVVENQGK